MDDAIVIWNQKAIIIAESFLSGKGVEFNRLTWKLQNYPLGFPISIASIITLFSKWNLNQAYFYSILILTLTLGTCFTFFLMINKKLDLIIISLITFVFISLSNYSFIQTDLCVDFPVSFGVFIFSYLILKKQTFNSTILISISLAWLSSLKNEGLLISIVCMILYFFIAKNNYNKKFLYISLLLIYILFSVPTLLHKLNVENLSSNVFIHGEKSFLEKIKILDNYKIILKYFLDYHIYEIHGISIAITIIVGFLRRAKIEFYLILLFWTISILYSSIYLLTNLNLVEHLDTSYNRIQYHLWMVLYVSIISTYISRKRIVLFLILEKIKYLQKTSILKSG
jgi:hypothetical protein